MRIDAAWLDTHEWMLRSSHDGVVYDGYQCAPLGVWEKAPDWEAVRMPRPSVYDAMKRVKARLAEEGFQEIFSPARQIATRDGR